MTIKMFGYQAYMSLYGRMRNNYQLFKWANFFFNQQRANKNQIKPIYIWA